jgi:hypothetical protein
MQIRQQNQLGERTRIPHHRSTFWQEPECRTKVSAGS